MARKAPSTSNTPQPEAKTLLLATGGALVVAAILLVVAILPAEYGLDPTGAGRLMGLTNLNAPASEEPPETNGTTYFSYAAGWPVKGAAAGTRSGTATEGQTSTETVDITSPNITRVTARLTWTDTEQVGGQSTKPDYMQIQVQAPDGRKGTAVLGRSAPAGTGYANATFDWRTPPMNRTVTATGPSEAYNMLRDLVPPDHSGVGTWTFFVTLVEAGDAEAGGVGVGGPAADTTAPWTLDVRVETFALDAGNLSASAQRRDVVNITLAAGKGLEYKLFVESGARFNYSWSAGGVALTYDFHGERAGDTSGAFTSHKNGTAATDSGQLVAPFTGTHGWYWKNTSGASVTIRLETQGVYTVVGIK
jgi:hypothetical protein